MQPPLLELWYQALGEPVGIIIMTDNPSILMQRLYKARADANDESLMGLSICTSPTSDNELWLVHKIVKVADAREGSGTPPEASD